MWKKVDTVVYYISPEFKFSATIAIFSFIGTIVKKITVVNDENKLEYLYDISLIKEKINLISEKGASIILYDSFATEFVDEVKKAIEIFQNDINCPIVSFISTKSNKYSKPFTGMIKIIELFYKNKNKTINKNLSIMIGNKAGRVGKNNRKIDKSCSDRAFAFNTGLHFSMPERFFLGNQNFITWEWDKHILNKPQREVLLNSASAITSPIILDKINILPVSTKYTIIVTGPPICGKTTLIKKLKRKWDADYNKGIIEINTSNLNNTEQAEKWVAEMLSKPQSIIIELTCIILNITKIIKKSMELGTPILIIEIKASPRILYLLDCIKVQQSASPDIILLARNYWNIYYKQYKKPTYDDILCVKHVEFPFIIQPSEEFWYEYSL
jgi:DNA 3'-phosphatase